MIKLSKIQKKHLNKYYRQFELAEILIHDLEENLHLIDDELEGLLYELRYHYYDVNNKINKVLNKHDII